MLDKIFDDCCNVDGDHELSDTWTGFTRFTFLKENPPDGSTWSGERDWRENKRPPGLTNDGLKCGNPCQMHPNVKKSKKWAVVDNDRRLRGIYFIDPKDEEFKDIVKNAPGKLETPMPAAMPCKTPICQSSRETRRSLGKHKTKYACIVEADESMRIRLEGGPYRYHKIHIAAKGMNSLTHCNLVQQVYSIASSNENTRCKGSSGKRMGKTRENTGMAADESQQQKWGDRWSKEWGQNRTLCVVNRSLSSQHLPRQSRIPRWHCKKMILVRMQCSLNRDHQCHKWRLQKWLGRYIKATRMRRTSSRRNICLHPGQNGRCTIITEKFRSQNVQIFGYVY